MAKTVLFQGIQFSQQSFKNSRIAMYNLKFN